MCMIDERIISLAEALGFDTNEKSSSLAELKGYIAAIKLIQDDMDALELQLWPETAQGRALDLFSNMFHLSSELDAEEKRQMIIDRYKYTYGSYKAGELCGKILAYGLDAGLLPYYLSIKTNSTVTSIIESGILDDLGDIINNYVAPITYIDIAGDGYDFDLWDGTGYTFDSYDRLDLPFYVLDSLN